MCFSASASLTVAGLLAIIGIASLNKAVKDKRLLMIACIPFWFAAQQFAEGILWLSAQNSDQFFKVAAIEKYIFLSIAFFIWPIWIPLSLLIAEEKTSRKNWLWILLSIGILYVGWLAWTLLTHQNFSAVSVSIVKNSIQYYLPLQHQWVHALLYAISTTIPPLISSLSQLWIFGVLNLIGLLIAFYFFKVTLVSVWCFFAAILSLCLYYVIFKNVKIYK